MRSQVQDVMTTDVVAVEEDAPYKEIVALLRRHRISAVPVLNSIGHVVGVVSESDLLVKEENPEAAWEPSFAYGRRKIDRNKAVGAVARDLMTAPAISIVGTTLVGEAARIMRTHGVKHLPIVEAGTGRLRGIVSRSDLLEVFLRPDVEIRDEIVALLSRLVPAADHVSVEVDDGVVSLSGQVAHALVGDLIRVVYGLEGVVAVLNGLRGQDDLPAVGATPYLRPDGHERRDRQLV